MRVGLFSDTYVPDINGVASSVATLQKALENAGHTVFVITTQPTLQSATLEDNILRLPGIELKFLYGYTMSGPLHLGAVKVVEEMNLDIIHVHTEFGVGLFARHCSKNLHIPLVTTYHTQYEDYTHYVNFLGIKAIDTLSRKAVASLSRAYTKNVQLIIAPSDKTRRMLMNYEIKKEIVIIPTGLDLERFKTKNESKISEIRQKYALEGSFAIIYLGRIAKEKSIDLVIESFAELVKRHPNSKLLIAGDGPSADELKDLTNTLKIAENVVFVGAVNRDDVPSYYHACDAFVSASLTETQGLTYIEALASGLSVFARPDKPLELLVIENETGYLFNNPQEFAEKALIYIGLNEDERSRINTNAYTVVSEYDLQTFNDRIISAYQIAIDSYHGRYTISDVGQDGEKTYIDFYQGSVQERVYFDSDIVQRRELESGMQLSRHEISSMDEDERVYDAYQLALKKIAIRDYTSYEIADYLRTRYECSEEQIETVLALLKNRHFIDDDRYFNDKIEYHRDQLRGNEWIVDDLRRRGFSTLDIQQYLEDEDEELYIERGLERSRKFLNSSNTGSRIQRKAKLRQHLQRQGYENAVIKSVLGQLEDDYALEDEKQSLERLMSKAYIRYLRKTDEANAKQKVMAYASSKGYPFNMIKEVMEDLDNDSED